MMIKKFIARIFSVFFVIAFILALIFSPLDLAPAHAAAIRYATPGGSGDCSSWANACSLQTALTGAASGDEIWAAAGTYKPTTDTNRNATFQLNSGVAMYGGFGGSETMRDQRNPDTHITVLSGDVDNNDSQTPIITDLTTVTGNTTNSYHVVTGTLNATGAILDGFTISAGNANGVDSTLYGGGMYNEDSSPTLTDVTFRGNSARDGGGMDNDYDSIVTLTNVTFSGNSASYGGGLYNFYNSPTLTDVTFSGNTATTDGGGMFNDNSSSALANVTFYSNTAATNGGGMDTNSGIPTLKNVTFNGNHATFGGGMYSSNGTPTLMGVTFSGNSATYSGGMDTNGGAPTLTNVTFSDNTAGGGSGGGMEITGGTPTLTNITFSSNYAWYGGGMAIIDTSSMQIRNTIFWQNTDIAIEPAGGQQIGNIRSYPSVSDSVIQGGCPPGSACTRILTSDPQLGTLGDYGGLTQTIPLLPGSSAIDTGNDAFCPATDQRGVARPQGAYCDIGAYEFTIAPVVNSITRLNPSPTSLAGVEFTVTFSQAVTGVDVSDFGLTTTGVSGAAVSGVSGSGNTYIVTVNTGSGAGTIRLDVLDDDTIMNLTLDPLGGVGVGNGNYTSGETYDVRFNWIYLPTVRK